VVIQKQHFAIVDRRVPVTAMPQNCLNGIDIYPRKNQILLIGYHQGERRLISMAYIASSQLAVVANCCPTYIDFAWFVSFESGDDSLPINEPSE
jgi:hypothetical protein